MSVQKLKDVNYSLLITSKLGVVEYYQECNFNELMEELRTLSQCTSYRNFYYIEIESTDDNIYNRGRIVKTFNKYDIVRDINDLHL